MVLDCSLRSQKLAAKVDIEVQSDSYKVSSGAICLARWLRSAFAPAPLIQSFSLTRAVTSNFAQKYLKIQPIFRRFCHEF